ncbi:MAG: diguanylate cyclase, partial [Methylococcaceae bacterium]|nr:diguanylate cyclase [Methylococcaceae bacterium]
MLEDKIPASILIVEDDPLDLQFIAAIVRSAGHAALTAKGGEQALELVAEHRPDLLLLDLLMPGMDGFEVIKRLKADGAYRDLPVIVITGIDDRDMRLRALELGADEMLTKPIHRAELLLRIGNQLRLQESLHLLADHSRRFAEAVEARTAELTASKARLEFLLAENPAVIYTSQTSGDYAITWVSPNIATLLGYTSADFTEAPDFWTARIHPDDRGRVFADLQGLSETDRCILEYRFRHADGNWRWMHDEPRLLREAAGKAREIVGYWVDCSERKRQEALIGYLSTHDSLTGLPNAVLLVDRLDQALIRARGESVRVALLVLNIDGFALLNQTLGIDGADLVLKQLAERFSHCLRDTDTIAHSGGAGFEIILPDIEEVADVATMASKLLDALSWPLEIGGQTVFVTACIGIALFPGDGDDFASLSAA